MSYKSLLFCPDEKSARVVTQVLSELEFSVELSNEPFAAVKTLTDKHFDALVVDCQNEQDASLLFKAARDSSLNHSSLSVAVVEGQAGVAKAFRIGANLVLTKPVNVEQSKSTLRVARGLLKKNSEARAASVTSAPSAKPASAPAVSPAGMSEPAPFAFPAVSANLPSMHPVAPVPAAPFAALEVEQERMPATEASEVALLESIPVDGKPAPAAEPMWAPKSSAEPIAASTAGHAAAAAPALSKVTELKLSGAAPMITNEPIVSELGTIDSLPEISVPTFSGLESAHSSSGGRSFVRKAAVLVILGGAGYLAWQRLQPLQYLPHGAAPAQTIKQPAATPELAQKPTQTSTPVAQFPSDSQSETTPSISAPDESAGTSDSISSAPSTAPETIRVQELPMSGEPKASGAPKPQATVIQVKPGPVARKPIQQQPTAPSLSLTGTSNSAAALNSIVASDSPAPTPSRGAFRISQGVSQGLVMKKVAPAYPPTALQLHKQGAVELLATISKDGAVTEVRVLSGDLMLANSAVAAVKQWKYRPYLLNGEPVEIQTQITVNFNLPR